MQTIPVDLHHKLINAFSFAQAQVRQLIEADPDYFPMYTEGGKWAHTGETWTNWCEGFQGASDNSVMMEKGCSLSGWG